MSGFPNRWLVREGAIFTAGGTVAGVVYVIGRGFKTIRKCEETYA